MVQGPGLDSWHIWTPTQGWLCYWASLGLTANRQASVPSSSQSSAAGSERRFETRDKRSAFWFHFCQTNFVMLVDISSHSAHIAHAIINHCHYYQQ